MELENSGRVTAGQGGGGGILEFREQDFVRQNDLLMASNRRGGQRFLRAADAGCRAAPFCFCKGAGVTLLTRWTPLSLPLLSSPSLNQLTSPPPPRNNPPPPAPSTRPPSPSL